MFSVAVVVVGWAAMVFASPQASVGQNMRRLVCVPMSSFDNICYLQEEVLLSLCETSSYI